MRPTVHLIQGIAGACVLYPFVGNKAFVFGISVVAIDADHFIEYYWQCKRLDIRGMFEHHDKILDNLDNYLGLNIFHTVECYLILYLLGLFFPIIKFVLMGFLFHHLFDEIELIRMKRPFAGAFSIIEYLIRKKNYYTTLDEVLRNKKQ